jgi:hypothetical protein
MRYFITVSRAKKAAGVDLIRIYLVDERRQQQDTSCRMYLSWLQEHFRQVNIPWGGEVVHWLPMSVCYRAGIIPPQDDVALYDNRVLLTSQYARSGQLKSRTFYEAGEDPDMLYWARSLMADVTKLVAGGAYLLGPAARASLCPW